MPTERILEARIGLASSALAAGRRTTAAAAETHTGHNQAAELTEATVDPVGRGC